MTTEPFADPSRRDCDDVEDDLRAALQLPDSIYLHVTFSQVVDRMAPTGMLLPPQLQFAGPKRQKEFLAGRQCAVEAFAKADYLLRTPLGLDADRLPCWPDGWLGSISHAGEGACAIVGRRADHSALGVDMECLVDKQVAMESRYQIASSGEFEVVSALPPDRAFTLLFSAKEALYKALYPSLRRFFDFSAAQAVSMQSNLLWLQLSEDWGADRPEGTRVPVRFVFRGDYVFSLVSYAAEVRPPMFDASHDVPASASPVGIAEI